MKYKITCLALLLFGCASFTSAQDETPTSVTVQNRTGDLPFSQTVGTGVEHVDIGSGNLIVDFPIISLPGRHMPFNYGLRYNALFWTVATRTQTNGQQLHFWSVERRPYIGGIDNGLGFTPTVPQLSWGISTETCNNVNGTPPDVKNTASGYIYTDAGGGKHSLPIVQVSASTPEGGCFVGQDGTGFFQGFSPGEGIFARAPDIYSTPAVYLPDGTQVAWPTDNSILNPPVTPDFWYPIGLGQYLDANGNSKCEPGGCNTVDTLGRNPLTIVNGSNQILYQVHDSDGVQRTYTVNLGTISVQTNFGIAGVSEHSQTRTVVTSIVLPNGTSYSFQYEPSSYGGLTSVTLPTGATISYTWATLSPSGNPYLTHRYVSGRTVTVGTKVFPWSFNKSCVDSGCFTVNTDVGDPMGKHTLYQHSEGRVVFAKVYDGAVGATLLRQYDVAYSSSTADPNALPIRITTTLENGLQSKVEFDYDTTGSVPGNVSEIREFDYAPGAPGALLRRTHKVYGLNTNSAYLAANIVNKVTQESVYDSTADTCKGVAGPCAQTQYEYDNYVAPENPLQATSSAPQHDYAGHGPSFTLRGNATRVKRWRNTDNAWLTTTYSYDDLGNIRSIKDPLGHVTSYDYGDSFYDSHCLPPTGTNAQAYASAVTNALGQRIEAVRYSCTALVQAHRDQNDIDAQRTGTTYTYDLMGRVLTKNLADGGQSSMAYNDAPPISTTTTTKITSALSLEATSMLDGLGRTVQAQLTSDPLGTDYTDTEYDAFGRPITVSNPYRSTSDPTYGITTNLYDALGRVYQTTKQDGSVSSVGYTGNCVTTTDEAGKQRRACTDGLGRLVEVDEPGDGTASTPASGGLTISGAMQSTTVGAHGATQSSGSLTFTGTEKIATVNGGTYCAAFDTMDTCVDWEINWIDVPDNGTVALTVGGHANSTSYGSTSTTASIASNLAAAINNDGAALVWASASGGTLTLTSRAAGSTVNYAWSLVVSSSDPADFATPSFAGSPGSGALSGGTSASGGTTIYDAGTVAMSLAGYSVTANYGNGTGQDSTASAVAADLVSKIQALLPGSNPPFTIAASGANISINWSSAGTAGNVTVTTTSTTGQATYFARPSFASCSIAANPQSCSTTLSGGADAAGPSLNAPYVTLYKYDALGNLLRVDQKGSAPNDSTQWRTRTFTYDSLSRLLTANNPESGTITYSYDADGNLLRKTSSAPNQTGTATQTVSYCYDELHRVTGKGYGAQSCPLATPVVTYAYDSGTNAIGKLTSLTDQAGTASYSYDILGRLSAETRTLTGANNAAISKNLSYEYNLDGSLYKLHYPSGNVVTYTPDSAGRTLSAIDSGNGINYVTSATYGPDSALTGFVSGNSATFAGITNAFSYNKRLQPVAMSANSPSQTVFSIGYDFHVGNGNNGNVFGITNYKDQNRNQTFAYDPLNRLISAQNAGTNCAATVIGGKTEYWGNSYGYDAWGNLLQKTVTKCGAENLIVTADAHNWIHASGTDYQYDAAGNMTFDATAALSYNFDQENRLTGAAGYAYTYDGDGNRVRKSSGSTGTLYWYMTPGIVGESDLSGNLTDEYVFFDGERVARKSTNGVFYYFSDHLKTASVITDSQGNIKSESDFYPWGGELQFVNNDSNHYKFTGKERDSETQLDYFGARYYSNGLGRWVSADWSPTPIPVPYADFGDPQSLNLYSYVRNIPTTQVDADGHDGPPTVYEAIDFLNRTFGLGIPTPQPLNAVLPQQGTPPAAQPQNAAPGLTYRDPGIPPANGELRDVLACTQRCANEPIVVTSTRERVPQHPADTPHGQGNAADLRVRPGHEDRVLQCAANCGARFGLNERRHPSRHATGPHVHIQIVPGRSGGRGDLPQPQRPPGRPCIGCGGPPDQRHQREVQEEMRH